MTTGTDLPVPAAGDAASRASRRMRNAWIVAIAADALQLLLLPFVLEGAWSPLDDVIDVATAAALIKLAGWHWAFLPSFALKLMPVVDLAPTWTIAMWVATRGKAPPPSAPAPPAPPAPGDAVR